MKYHWTDDATEPVFGIVIDAHGRNGNIFAILDTARRLLRELDVPTDRIDVLTDNVKNAVSYDQAVAFIEAWFRVE